MQLWKAIYCNWGKLPW